MFVGAAGGALNRDTRLVATSGGNISAHLTKTSFKSSQAAKVRIIYRFSAPSKSFSYLLTFKKGSKWQKVTSVKKTGSFRGSKSMTVKQVFAGKSVKVGRYRLKLSADGGSKLLTFKVVKAKGGGSTPIGGKPVNTALPTILPTVSGLAKQGQTLTTSNGSWTNSPISYAYQWRRCSSAGAGCADISGATARSYKLVYADTAHTIRVVVTASNAYGAISAISSETDVIFGLSPVNTALPTITGTAKQGRALTTSNASWTNSPTFYTYQWRRCNSSGASCTDISGATARSYAPVYADAAHTIRVVVTAANAWGWTSATSKRYPTSGTVTGLPPVNTALPTITGTAEQDQVLTTSDGSWANSPTFYMYQWRRCNSSGMNCSDISGATTSSYTLVYADAAHTIRVVVMVANPYGFASATSSQYPASETVTGLPPVNAALPIISGTAKQGQVLTTSDGSWTNSPTYTYQWQRCDSSGAGCADISGATARSYTPAYADAANTIRAVVTATNDYGSASATSSATDVIVGLSPVNTALPTITGTAKQGQVLTTSDGSWTNSPTYAYQWQRCNSTGAGCADISGATTSSYRLVYADAAHTIRAVVTATNPYGPTAATSKRYPATGTVTGLPPVNTALPTITGTATQGQVLTSSDGSWTNSPTSYTYRWRRCNSSGAGCVDISGATASSYTLVYADAAHTVRAVVTATNPYGPTTATSSQHPATGTVTGLPPVNTALPTITGTAKQGQVLATSNGSWTNSPISYAYQWQRCNSSGASCIDISGATASSYTPVYADAAHTIRAVVKATNPYGSVSATSKRYPASGTVTGLPPVNTALPTISGTAKQDQVLTTSDGSWTNSATSYAYQWQRCNSSGASCTDISGATTSSYTLVYADAAHTIRAVVTATNPYGPTAATSKWYPAAGTVTGLPPVNTALPTITGTAIQGQVLTTSDGSWTNSPSYTYQWQRCDSSGAGCADISGATTSSYTLVYADAANTIRAVVKATNPYGSVSATSSQYPATGTVTGLPPVNTALPIITGTAKQDQVLTTSDGSWTNSPTSYTYQWQRCNSSGAGCADISSATANSYRLTYLDAAHTIRVVVTATNPYGSTAATSSQTAAVAAIYSTVTSGGAGYHHSCALLTGGTVKCWGLNNYGQLGDGTTTNRSTSVTVGGITNAIAISAGDYHTCALLSDGTVKCWGRNDVGQLGNNTTTDSPTPVQVSGITNAVSVSAGYSYNCALLANSTIRCWGYNAYGQLGNSTTTDSPTPVQVGGITNAAAIDAGYRHTCALLSDGTIKCWGSNSYGQLGNNTTTDSSTPGTVNEITNAVSVSAGGLHTCALLSDGTLKCWGLNSYGQLGNNTTTDSSTPVPVSEITNAVGVSVGDFHTCALLTGGSSGGPLECWGRDGNGQLGNSGMTDSSTPVQVDGITNAVVVSGGASHTCALLSGGTVKCWGRNDVGQLGNNTTTDSSTQVRVIGIKDASVVGAGASHTCALLSDGSVECWGRNNYGQLGDGTTTDSSTHVPVSGITNAVAVSAGASHTCAVLSSGTVKCWGRNDIGQLGDGTTTGSPTPVQVSGITNAVAISAGDYHTCALLTGGAVRCWGRNNSGQLGNGTTTDSSTPVPVSGITNAVSVSAGYSYTCAPLADSTIRCWGGNNFGQLGNGTTTDSSTPVLVSAIATATAVDAGADHACALLTGGTVRCWGRNDVGQLGNGTTTGSPTPVPVSGITNAVATSAGYGPTCALLSDGTIQCWGSNSYGQLGNSTTTDSSIPVVVSTLTNASAVSAGGNHTCALLSNGAVACWGDNENGQLGDYTTTNSSTPVGVVGLTP